jgi:type IV pilus assembly protein PilA
MKRKAIKAFTLIELLVVVAIIGILSAAGVYTYNGFQNKAKAAATKSIHKNIQKKLSAELVKCSLGDTTIFNSLSCSGITGSTVVSNIGSAGSVFTDKNPWSGAEWGVKSGSSFVLGQISLSASGQIITLKTCTKTGCATADQLTDTITVE